jgi:hypothetical protein
MKHLVKQASTLAIACSLACGGSGGGGDAATPACDAACQDGVALVALRDAMRDIYNLTLQGQPEGAQNKTTDCPLGGSATVTGNAMSNGKVGTTTVSLTYVFASCVYAATDSDPTHTFKLTLDGSISEIGMIAVEPSSTTALSFVSPASSQSAAISFSGTVYDPAKSYTQGPCSLKLGQDGNDISGTICDRDAGASL